MSGTHDVLIASLNGGELSEKIYGRNDLEKYFSGCKKLENFIPYTQGGVVRRSGTHHVYQTLSNLSSRLVPFRFSATQNYILEFGNCKMRVYYDGGLLMDGESQVIIDTPWYTSNLRDLSFSQSADTLFVACPGYAPRKITRVDATTWTLETIDLDPSPVLDLYPEDVTLTMSSISGSTGKEGEDVYLASDVDFFESDWLGRWIRIDWTRNEEYTKLPDRDSTSTPWYGDPWEVVGEWKFHYRYANDGLNPFRLQYSLDGGVSWQDWSILRNTMTWTDITGNLSMGEDGVHPQMRLISVDGDTQPLWSDFRLLKEERHGYLKITSYLNSKQVACKVYKDCLCTDGRGLKSFYLGAFCQDQGYPSVVAIHQQRLWFAGTTEAPQTIWGSQVGDFYNFDRGTGEDDESVMFTADADQVNNIQWVVPMKSLVIGTAGAEWMLSSSGGVVTPSDREMSRQSAYGSKNIPAILAAGFVVYVQSDGKKVLQMTYDYNSDSWFSQDLTLLADHVTGDGVLDLSLQQTPFNVIWSTRDDGQLIGCTYLPDQKVYGWHRHVLGGDGEVESVAWIPGQVWLVVKRTINGSTKRYVEYFADWDETLANAWFLDSALSYEGEATTTLSGLDHLEGEEVAVFDGSGYAGTFTVASGAITLDEAVTYAVVGLDYDSTGAPMNLELSYQQGTTFSTKKRVTSALLNLYKTKGGYAGSSEDELYDIEYEAWETQPFTGRKKIDLASGSDYEKTVYFKQNHGLPMSVTCVVPELSVGK